MEEDKKTGETAADSGETVDGGHELPEVEKVITDDDQLNKVETEPPVVAETPKKTATAVPGVTQTPLPSGMEYGAPAETVRYQEGVKRRSVWWHIATLVGIVVVIGLLVFQQFNGDTAADNGAEKVIAAIVDDGNTTRTEVFYHGNEVEKTVAKVVKADGKLTRLALGPDGDLWKLLKRFQELVVADPSNPNGDGEPLPGLLNIVAGLNLETRDGVRGLRRSLKSHDMRLTEHERASADRAGSLEDYLKSLNSQYGTTALGIQELRERGERPIKVRVIIPRTKVVVGK